MRDIRVMGASVAPYMDRPNSPLAAWAHLYAIVCHLSLPILFVILSVSIHLNTTLLGTHNISQHQRPTFYQRINTRHTTWERILRPA